MLHYTELEKKVFGRCLDVPTEDFNIISGYLGIEPIKELTELPDGVNVTIIYGMYGQDGIAAPLHKALLNLHTTLSNITILYSTIPVHSKIYFWKNNGDLQSALIGSANFSVSGLRNDYKEILADVDTNDFLECEKYYEYVLRHSIPCTDPSITPKKIVRGARTTKNVQPLLASGTCRMTLLDSKNLVPKKSGLNWGCGKGHVSKGDAYLSISIEYIRLFPHMFPPKKYLGGAGEDSKGKKNRENDEVDLIWDDGTTMTGLLEGQIKNSYDNLTYPKQLSSSPRKSILGKYLRNRIGVDEDHIITKSDLKRYGRTHIDITQLSEGIYYLDFSTKK